MKKIFSAILAVMMVTVMAHAAGNTPTTAKKAVKAEAAPVAAKTKEATVAKTKTVKSTATTTGVKLKADGTPDKRYTKTTATAGPKKADGTADMRYKANQTAKTKTVKAVKKVEATK